MKIKRGFYATLLLGITAGVVRVIQYLFTVGADGYTDPGALPSFLQGLLAGLLAVGVIAALLTGFGKKGQRTPAQITGQWGVLFYPLGLLALVEGILRFPLESGLIPRLACVSCFTAALGWVLLGVLGQKGLGLLGLLPLLHQGLRIVDFFRSTYKYLRVSEYTLTTLGMCALCFFTLLLMKAYAEADCAKTRVVFAACTVLVMAPAAFLAPVAGAFSLKHLLLALESACYILLAVSALQSAAQPPAPPAEEEEPAKGPDLSVLNEYINNIPEVEDENHDNP